MLKEHSQPMHTLPLQHLKLETLSSSKCAENQSHILSATPQLQSAWFQQVRTAYPNNNATRVQMSTARGGLSLFMKLGFRCIGTWLSHDWDPTFAHKTRFRSTGTLCS